ncbi:serine hydrolase domain-containing protein [Jannaschia pohangensis]|uniref:CubicO group peptidase, beta-lactamase class C family n=1 Tax=Jannaschia pohangensis TaxID=390807 RepID=A0A1I3M1M2_9RHOB|nr:serine hydrolase domain-containing protein [Jannaschia pohangensis]SFI90690.1 CubicO group peptidase, beta-lactamase class C family [Jannaschia pohangensis]
MIRAALIFLGLAGAAFAQGDAPAFQADAAVTIATWSANGVTVDVAGSPNPEGGTLTDADMWHIGSLTKAMTATLAGRAVAAGAIDWDTTVGALLDADPVWRDVTLAELLTHRSGMAANLPRWRAILRPDRAAYVGHMLGSSPVGARGEFLYSNAGYVVAGAMLEAAQAEPWEDLIQREVFAPLGMEEVGFGAPPRIWGHRGGRPVRPGPGADNIPAMGPAGTVHASPRAMLRFLAAHATQDPEFLPPEVWARLHRPVGDYAMGWRVEDRALRHAGSNTMWFARVEVRDGWAAFVAVNEGSAAAQARTEQVIEGLWPDAPPARPEAPRPSE